MQSKVSVEFESNDQVSSLLGRLDENIQLIEENFGVESQLDGLTLNFKGPEDKVGQVKELIDQLLQVLQKQKRLDKQDILYAMNLKKDGIDSNLADLYAETFVYTAMGKPIRAKTLGQKRYLDAIQKNDVVFGVGPAGTGKTYLAMACAVKAFKEQKVSRIILTRPAVEAGESLGFLPGDLQMKVDPYLRPLYDALFDLMGYDTYQKYVEQGLIEVAPLAYMRGRTLDNAYIILDEAQNTTPQQMKMFLTRLGFGSKAIITGDITQIDLPSGKKSGLKTVLKILKDVRGVSSVYLTRYDIVRHPLVQRIIDAYDRFDSKEKANKDEKKKLKKEEEVHEQAKE
ncbi:MAG: PhoH family protein [Peptoniphilus sp. oral taxon 375]|nr:PhoH family protein [Peptoniphilus sp. oral taxon 375]